MTTRLRTPAAAVADRRSSSARRERGAVLIVGLVMLAVMTLLVVSMIKTSVVELKIGGANQIAQQHQTNAEVMINTFINANNGRFASNYLALPAASGGPAALPGNPSSSYNATSNIYSVVPSSTHLGTADLNVRQIQCSGQRQTGIAFGAIQFVFFDVRSTATGDLGGSATVHQGIRSVVPAGSC
jgi:Tfp pilus assembly protein PilX